MNIIAIIPLKYNSTRVPGKNFRLMNGKPLYWYIFNTLSQISLINKIICNTDSFEIESMVKKDFPHVEIYFRPKHLEGGHISTNLLLLDTIKTLNLKDKNNIFLQTHVTNPLLSKKTVEECINKYSQDSKSDSLYTVKQLQTRLYDKMGKAINHDPKELIPTQNLDPIYEENSCIYMFSYKVLKEYNHRIGQTPSFYIMGDIESSDIDYESDFILTETLMKLQNKKNKVIIVTGSAGGIGSSIVDYYHKKKWIVVGIDKIFKNNTDIFFEYDLTQNNDFTSCINDIIQKYGRIDCLVNNAALQICKSWDEYNEEDWNNTLNCNLKTCYSLSKSCRKYLKESKGSIVNICSIHAVATSENIGLYAMSKSALQGLTKSMALEYINDQIRINCILPGAIETPMLMKSINRSKDPTKAKEKLKIGQPKDIAKSVYFLSKSKFSVGSSIIVDGGVSVKLSSE